MTAPEPMLRSAKDILAFVAKLGLPRTDRTLRLWIQKQNFPAYRLRGELIARPEAVRMWVELQARPAASEHAA